MRCLLYMVIILSAASLSFPTKAEQENPFFKLAGKTHEEYYDAYSRLSDHTLHYHSHGSTKLMRGFAEATKTDSMGNRSLNHQMVSLHKELFKNKGSLILNDKYDLAQLAKHMLLVVEEAERLRQAEQQLRIVDQRLHEEQLNIEKLQARHHRRIMYIAAITAIVILILLIMLFHLYKKKQKFYKNIVRQIQRWVDVDDALERVADSNTNDPREGDSDEKGRPDSIKNQEQTLYDILVMETIKKAISTGKLYKQHNLSLDTLASETGLNRYYISGAMNRCTGKHFNAFINEYRVKEAIRLASNPKTAHATIEEIAFESGFNDRTSFYRSFKKITGISPAEFRKNLSIKP